MQLYYFDFQNRFAGGTNFGDNLNPWLWDRLLPGVFDQDASQIFVGIGTLLNRKDLPQARRTVVFSSGVGYGDPPIPDASWRIYCVRGPLSAQKLGVSEHYALTDGAVLVRRVYQPSSTKRYRFAYMPHVWQAVQGGQSWQRVCDQLGFAYIDPRWSTEQVLAALSETEILLTEAMHGAIVADALRVSWIPIRTTAKILAFKWQDWCQSVGLEYTPHQVMKLEDPTAKLSLYAAARYQLKIQVAATQLGWIAGRVRPTLSNEQRLDRLTSEVWQRLQQFQQDLAEGRFTLSPSETESLVPTLAGFSYEI